MLKAPNTGEIPVAWIGDLPIVESLYEAEAPVIFTTRNAAGQRLLAYVADEDADATWIALAPCSLASIDDLKHGRVPVRDVLTASWMYLVRRTVTGVSGAWSVPAEWFPADHLPLSGTLLLPEHEPVLATRAIGPEITAGAVPASVVSFVAEATRKAVKTLLDYRFEREAGGRPPKFFKDLYDLPALRLAFHSFEISFASPVTFDDAPEMRDAADLLQRALTWASDTRDLALEGTSEEERGAMLHAVLPLTPPSGGAVVEVEMSGSWIPEGPTKLTRASRQKVKREIQRLRTERRIVVEGRFGEVDRDAFTFTLRETDDGHEYVGWFDEILVDDVVEAFAAKSRVVVSGTERASRLTIDKIISTDPVD